MFRREFWAEKDRTKCAQRRVDPPKNAENRQKTDDIVEEKEVFVTIKAKNVLAVVLTAILTVLCCVGLNFEAVADVYNGKSVRKLPVYGVDCGEEKKVALTFDAAWGADKTQSILDTLEENGATGTFFLVGFWVDKYPDMVKAIANSGCEASIRAASWSGVMPTRRTMPTMSRFSSSVTWLSISSLRAESLAIFSLFFSFSASSFVIFGFKINAPFYGNLA